MSLVPSRPPALRRRAAAIKGLMAAVVFTSVWAHAGSARAYVRYLSPSGCPYSWRTRIIPITGYPAGLDELDDATIGNAATQAAEVWGKRDPTQAACTDLDLQVTIVSRTLNPPAAKFDHVNNLIFRNDVWCQDQANNCSSAALAITTVFAHTSGEIVDADIEVNAANFHWADLTMTNDVPGAQDLQNALTHEMGHLIGLDHTCYGDPTRPRPTDNAGNPVPDCSDPSLPASIRATTMFASADPGDISKRTLEPDDQQAVCDIYPTGKPDPLECAAPEQKNGCQIAPGVGHDSDGDSPLSRPWLAVGAVVVAFGMWAGTRRARQGRGRD